jgi:saccharopine dehydrogenase-like NADP-dependent oxidoreductase
MRHILLFGTGKSATVLIDYLLKNALAENWHLTVVDADLALATAKLSGSPHGTALSFNINEEAARNAAIEKSDLVISMLPPALHYLVALDCIAFGKHLLTASYTDEKIKALAPEVAAKGLLFLCEMGLDPGIDHLSAMKMIHGIKEAGGHIVSFKSYCGGLIAPESDNNPWHYKISWNPRNIVAAGQSGAIYLENGAEKQVSYEALFADSKEISVSGPGQLAYYANRDSLAYIPLYGLEDCPDFLRATLRYPAFCKGWHYIAQSGLADYTDNIESDGLSYADWTNATLKGLALPADVQLQWDFLGLFSQDLINKGRLSSGAILQSLVETKLAMLPSDKDMIVMQHEILYQQGASPLRSLTSTLVVKGDDSLRTAMAKTVGLPLGITAKLLLNGVITLRGLHIPILPEIYLPVLAELEVNGVRFTEEEGNLA